jgi:Leucine-rich repeat (LRR) protein
MTTWEFSGYEDVGELAPLAQLRDVTVVKKSHTRPADAPALSLKSLDALRAHQGLVEVDLEWECDVEDISAVAALPALERLLLGEVKGELWALARCQKLTTLALQGARLTSLGPILPLAGQLTSLSLSHTGLVTLDGVERFTQLQHLSVGDAKVSRLPSLPPSLRSVSLERLDALDDVSALAACPSLERVDLGYSAAVADLAPLAGLPLVELGLDGLTRLTDAALQVLTAVPTLRALSLGSTNVRSLELLCALPQLRQVVLYGCQALDLAEVTRVVPRLPQLEVLHCDGDGREVRRLAPWVSVNNAPGRARREVQRVKD